MTIIENNTKLQFVPKLSAVIVNHKPTHFRHLTVGALVGAIIFLYLHVLTADTAFPTTVSLKAIFFISGVSACGALLMSHLTEGMACLENEYLNTLNSYQQIDLIKLAKSPELNNSEQELVVQFLNQTYPGWSIVGSN